MLGSGNIKKWWIFGIAILLFSGSVAAEIYKYKDNRGNLYFTDRPMHGSGYRLIWRSGPKRHRSGSRIDTTASERNRQRYSPMIDAVARQNNLRPALLHAVIYAESAYDPNALSSKGARGLMQLMPDTARRFGVQNSWDPKQNLTGGAKYLSELLALFEQDIRLAVAAYNAGENAVIRYGNRVPPFPETQEYVKKVVRYYRSLVGSDNYLSLR